MGDAALELKWLNPEDLEANERNWRGHPPTQRVALEQALNAVGWAGAALYNKTTSRLIDGHLRKKVAIERGERIPVLVGEWTEEQERLILSTLDPIAGLAEANSEALDSLLAEVRHDIAGGRLEFDAGALEDLLAGYGADPPNSSEWGAALGVLPEGDRSPFQQMTFTLSDAQAETVRQALEAAKDAGSFGETGNENSNGNALARISAAYVG